MVLKSTESCWPLKVKKKMMKMIKKLMTRKMKLSWSTLIAPTQMLVRQPIQAAILKLTITHTPMKVLCEFI